MATRRTAPCQIALRVSEETRERYRRTLAQARTTQPMLTEAEFLAKLLDAYDVHAAITQARDTGTDRP